MCLRWKAALALDYQMGSERTRRKPAPPLGRSVVTVLHRCQMAGACGDVASARPTPYNVLVREVLDLSGFAAGRRRKLEYLPSKQAVAGSSPVSRSTPLHFRHAGLSEKYPEARHLGQLESHTKLAIIDAKCVPFFLLLPFA